MEEEINIEASELSSQDKEAIAQMNLQILEANTRLLRERYMTALFMGDQEMAKASQLELQEMLSSPTGLENDEEYIPDLRDKYCSACGMDKDDRGICTNPLCRAHSLGETLWNLRKDEAVKGDNP